MKKFFILILFVFTLPCVAQLKTPALSPSSTLKQTIGLTDVEVQYSRPSVKDREIFSKNGLLPYGQIWRTGANSATKITFSDSVTVANKKFAKGSYTFLAIPAATTWELQWYPYNSKDWTTYQEQTPLATITVPVTSIPFTETFEIRCTDITMESGNLTLAWERSQVQIPMKMNTISKTLKAIDGVMTGPSLNDYFQAAVFLHENNTDLTRALSYIQKVTPERRLFFVVTREAQILKDLNKNKEALAVARTALSLSKKAENNDFIKINQDIINALK